VWDTIKQRLKSKLRTLLLFMANEELSRSRLKWSADETRGQRVFDCNCKQNPWRLSAPA